MRDEAPFQSGYLDKLRDATNPSPLIAGNDVLVDRRVLRALIYMAQRALVYEDALREDVRILSGYAKNHRDKVPAIEANREHTEEEREALIGSAMEKCWANESRCDQINALFGWPDSI